MSSWQDFAYQTGKGIGHFARQTSTGLQRNKVYTNLSIYHQWVQIPECLNVCLPTGAHPPANDRLVQCKFRRVRLAQSLA